MIVYDSLCTFSQVAVYMNFDVQVFKWTACPCQRRPPLEPRASMYAKRSSPSRNQSNTPQNESLKEEIRFGSYFLEIFLSFNLRILRRHGTGTSISRATAGRPRYLI